MWLRMLLISLLIGLACLAIIPLSPYTSLVCPAWTIQIVDEAGSPVKGALVTQYWQDYTVESGSHKQVAYADENGYVSFPERNVSASPLSRTWGVIWNTVSLGVHASYGASAHLLAYGKVVDGKRLEGSASYLVGQPLPERLVTRVYDSGCP
ncbi:MAG TPA: hypothetical protein VGB76_12885 [Pyrinomonadaceae bacterium]